MPANVAFTPAGSPVAIPIPVAPVVVKVILGEIAVLIHKVGFDDAGVTVLFGVTMIVPVADADPHVPVSGME